MSIGTEFRKFIARGNVLDLAVGVVIGAAFGKITSSLAEGVIMPTIGWLMGDINFSNYFIRLGEIPEGYEGSVSNYAELKEAGVAMIGYGDFLTQIVNFLLLAFAVFMLLKVINRVLDEMQNKQAETEDSSKTDEVPTDPQLDVLKKILAELRHDGGGDGSGSGEGAVKAAA
ncbi:large conductance mechanosensitive channel protein MscL [Qipengyuania nanhaisediminis]|uniref:large conductance mechanosensitive channel protein MscL n=1 Tax=Qipengyuania nanhaisediminis TaxID=604088 RepID=UPI0038B405CA